MLTPQQSRFLQESNAIEGEEWESLQYEAMIFALAHIHKNIHPGDILNLHEKHKRACVLFHGGKEHITFGKLRTCNIRIGGRVCVPPEDVPEHIKKYCVDWHGMTSWEAHVRFELIHPFEDLNGRVGRLLWLIKALEEGYNYSIPFLQKFYYQTLEHFANEINNMQNYS